MSSSATTTLQAMEEGINTSFSLSDWEFLCFFFYFFFVYDMAYYIDYIFLYVLRTIPNTFG